MWLCAIYLTIFQSLFHFFNILFQSRLHIILFFIYACVVLKKIFIYHRYNMQQPKFLNKLDKGKHPHGVVVRVVRKWTHYETTSQGAPLYIGMVLVDAKVLFLFVLYILRIHKQL